jgi:hypothetical protein
VEQIILLHTGIAQIINANQIVPTLGREGFGFGKIHYCWLKHSYHPPSYKFFYFHYKSTPKIVQAKK